MNRLGCVNGGVLTNGEGGVDAAPAVGTAVGSGSVALTQATGQQSQSVLTGGVLGGIFIIFEGCVCAGGQVNPGVDMAVFIGGDDSPDGVVIVDRGGVVTGYLAVVNLQANNGCLLILRVAPAVTGQVQFAALNRLGVLDVKEPSAGAQVFESSLGAGVGSAVALGSAVLLCSALGVAEGVAAGSEATPIGSLESANAVGAVRAAPGATSAPASATTAPYRAAARAGR